MNTINAFVFSAYCFVLFCSICSQMKGDTLHNTIHKNRSLYDYQSTMSILNQVAQVSKLVWGGGAL